jgi:hypothetical protein
MDNIPQIEFEYMQRLASIIHEKITDQSIEAKNLIRYSQLSDIKDMPFIHEESLRVVWIPEKSLNHTDSIVLELLYQQSKIFYDKQFPSMANLILPENIDDRVLSSEFETLLEYGIIYLASDNTSAQDQAQHIMASHLREVELTWQTSQYD